MGLNLFSLFGIAALWTAVITTAFEGAIPNGASFPPVGERAVDRYPALWGTLPGPPGFSSPYTGNGDIGAIYGASRQQSDDPRRGAPFATGGASTDLSGILTGEQVTALGKNDFWISEGKDYFGHLSGPWLAFQITEPKGLSFSDSGNNSVTQDLGKAVVTSFLISDDNSTTLTSSTVVGEAGTNASFTTVVCTRTDGQPCELSITLRDCCGNHAGVTEHAGASPDGSVLFFRKENLHDGGATNPAYIGSCDAQQLFYNLERSFVVSPTSNTLAMANGSCLWVLDPSNATSSAITTGSCQQPQGQWTFVEASPAAGSAPGQQRVGNLEAANFSQGRIAWTGANTTANSNLCLGASARLTPCTSAPTWTMNTSSGPSNGFLSTGGHDSCLVVVPDNSNNTLAAATAVTMASPSHFGKAGILQPKVPGAPVNSSDAAAGSTMVVALQSGIAYTIVTAVLTLRDLGCAGTRSQSEQCPQPIQNAAMAHTIQLANGTAFADAMKARELFWADFWSRSEIDITQGSDQATSNATELEKWYYGMQYSFGTNVRQGKVAPSLSGIFNVNDPLPWNDQLTIDYNFESNFWGAGSSNHLDLIMPYIATVTSPPVLETMRERSSTPGVWNDAPNDHWPGTVGSVAGAASCPPVGNCNMLRDLGHDGGYRGANWPSTMFPLGDGRPAPTDLATRFIGGLVATPLIQYFEYSRDLEVLRDLVYPVVRDNAEFYASFAINQSNTHESPHLGNGIGISALGGSMNSNPILFPFTCAQEAYVQLTAGLRHDCVRQQLTLFRITCT